MRGAKLREQHPSGAGGDTPGVAMADSYGAIPPTRLRGLRKYKVAAPRPPAARPTAPPAAPATRSPLGPCGACCAPHARARCLQVGVLALGVLCGVAAFAAVTMLQGRRVSLLDVVLRRAPRQQLYRSDYPWASGSGGSDPFGYGKNEFSNSFDALEDPFAPSAAGFGYGFEPELNTPLGGAGDGYPLYSPEACIPQTYSEMPPGYICSSPTNGVYALDPYGNLYGRRIQWKLRKILQSEEASAVNTARHVPDMVKHRHHFNWISPMDWLEPSLLPNASTCQALVEGFYEAISSPMSEDLVNATEFLDDNFLYSGSDVALVPGCVADVPPGYKVKGSENWAAAYTKTVNAFGNTTSELYGNVSCTPQRNELNKLLPTMLCVANHHCTFALKSITNSTGMPVTLEGSIVDSIVFNTEGKIIAIKSEFDPKHFYVQGKNWTKASDDDAKVVMTA